MNEHIFLACEEPKLKLLLELFKALSNPLRLSIARLICKKPRYANEIESSFNCDRTNVIKHLNILRKAGVIEMTKEGRKTLYTFRPQYIKELVMCLDPEHYIATLEQQLKEKN